jgi:hypothetical protein
MKTRHALAILVALLVLGPAGLSISAYFMLLLVPAALLVLPALLVLGVATPPALLLFGGRPEQPAGPSLTVLGAAHRRWFPDLESAQHIRFRQRKQR